MNIFRRGSGESNEPGNGIRVKSLRAFKSPEAGNNYDFTAQQYRGCAGVMYTITTYTRQHCRMLVIKVEKGMGLCLLNKVCTTC